MRIDLHPKAPEVRDAAKPDRGRAPKSSHVPESGVKDEARVSSNAARIEALEKHINELPEIREAKVEPLRAAVQNGRYDVSAEKLADALFAAMLAHR